MTVTTLSIETVRCMVASGYGISVLPSASTSGIYKNDWVVSIPFDEPPPSRQRRLSCSEVEISLDYFSL